jgi:hypothetical protein
MSRFLWRPLLVSAVLALGLASLPVQPTLATHTVDPAFAEYYDTHDGPRVLGPAITPREGVVQYFEKGRLEDHRDTGVPTAWEFMLGRLAADLVDVGAGLPIAGETGPTYADAREHADPSRRLAPPEDIDGVQTVANGVFIPYDSRLRAAPGYVVPTAFWDHIRDPRLFPAGWLHDIGLPLTPVFQAAVTKAGQSRSVEIQVFERTVLTFDAANPTGWQLERANIGVHYLAALRPPTPGPTPAYPDWKGEYFANADLSGQPLLVRNDVVIDFTWGEAAPAANLPADSFSIRWTRTLPVDEEATYHVSVRADDGVRIWIADRLIVDQWHSTRRADGYMLLKPGSHAVRVEYHEQTGNARIELDLTRLDSYPNWTGRYYNNPDLKGDPFFVRNDSSIDFDWGDGSPGSGLRRNNFSVRWTRQPRFETGTYRFTVTADDGVRLYVDGKKVLDRWDARGEATTSIVDVAMRNGRRAVRLDYRDRSGDAQVTLTYRRQP